MTKVHLIHCAAADLTEAETIAQVLLDERLAACVQLTPTASRYVWKGAAARADEVLLVIKTRAALFAAVAARIRQLHSYETPEILAIEAAAVDDGYLAWLETSTREG